MGSDKYGALSGAIARSQMLDQISRNLANVDTTGYKKGSLTFETKLQDAVATRDKVPTNQVQASSENIDFSQGVLNRTEVETHLAINGPGFLKLQQDDGQIVYTRRGNFRASATGELVTATGSRLLGAGGLPLVLPTTDYIISRDGSVISENQVVGKIPLYTIEETDRLQRAQTGAFVAPAGVLAVEDTSSDLMQGFLELSNVSTMEEMGRMVFNTRVFEATQKVLNIYSQMNSKLSDLGNLQ